MARRIRKTAWSRPSERLEDDDADGDGCRQPGDHEKLARRAIGRQAGNGQKAIAPSANWTDGDRHRRCRASPLSALQAVRRAAPRASAVAGHAARLRAGCRSAGRQQSDEPDRGTRAFFVLYPEQDRLSNVQGCWNWYDTRTGRAQAEAHSISARHRAGLPVASRRPQPGCTGGNFGRRRHGRAAGNAASGALSGNRHAFGNRAGRRAFFGERHQGHVRPKRDDVAAAACCRRCATTRVAGYPRYGGPRRGAEEWC